MCNWVVPKVVKFTKEVASSLRLIFRKKEETSAAFDFLSPPKEEKRRERGKACPAV